jgi:hypothetical protein
LATRAYLALLDEFWAEQIAASEDIREGLPLVPFGGRSPAIEYRRMLEEAFDMGLARVEARMTEIARRIAAGEGEGALEGLEIGEGEGTWTYQVDEEPLPPFSLAGLASAPAGLAAIGAFPMLIFAAFAKLIARIEGFIAARQRARGGEVKER